MMQHIRHITWFLKHFGPIWIDLVFSL